MALDDRGVLIDGGDAQPLSVRRAGKKQKGVILGEFVESTGYQRKYAIHLLNSWGRTRVVRIDGQLVKLVVGRPQRAKRRASDRAATTRRC